MRKIYLLTSLLFISFVNVGFAHDKVKDKSDEFKLEINKAYKGFTRYLEEGKPIELVEEYYTKDAKFFPPHGGVAEGHEAIGAAFKGMVEAGVIVVPQAIEVEDYGHHIYEYGVATLYNKKGETLAKERYVVIWKLVDGKWRIHRDFVKGRAME